LHAHATLNPTYNSAITSASGPSHSSCETYPNNYSPGALALGIDPNMPKIGDVFQNQPVFSIGTLNESIIANTKFAQHILQHNWPQEANLWPSDMQVHLMVLFYQVFYTSGPLAAIESIQAPFRASLALAEVGKIESEFKDIKLA